MEDKETELLTLLQEVDKNYKDSEARSLRMESNLKNIQCCLERSEENLEATLFTLNRTEYNLGQANKMARYAIRWAVACIVFSALVSVFSILYSIHTSRKVAKDIEETKIELRKTLNDITVREDQSFSESTAKEGSPRYPAYSPYAISPSDRHRYRPRS